MLIDKYDFKLGNVQIYKIMGVWGTGISSNDVYADVYSFFFELYDEGLAVSQITEKLIDQNKDIINDQDEKNNFWFALAKAQWECKCLDKEVFNLVKHIIETGEDLKVWEELDCEAQDLKKRKQVLDNFLVKLQTEKSKPRPRKKFIVADPAFEKGDCYAFKLKNGNYGGFITLDSYKGDKYSANLIAVTRLNSGRRPDVNDFIKADILVRSYGRYNDEPSIFVYSPGKHKDTKELVVEYIGRVKVNRKYEFKEFGSIGNLELWVVEVANKQFEYETEHERPAGKYTVKSMIENRWWHFWCRI